MGINYFRRDSWDTKFLLFEHMNIENLLKYEAYKDFSRDDFDNHLEVVSAEDQ